MCLLGSADRGASLLHCLWERSADPGRWSSRLVGFAWCGSPKDCRWLGPLEVGRGGSSGERGLRIALGGDRQSIS